MKGFSSQWRS
jgi:hypothetical protein